MGTFEVKNEANYAAQVIRVESLTPLEGLDRLVALHWAGFQALVSKNTQVGDLVIMFPPESQLSQTYAAVNNLHSRAELNADTTVKGYLPNNRRVRAIRLRGNVSNCLAMPVSSLSRFTQETPEVGTSFDTVAGVEISRKFEPKQSHPTGTRTNVEKMWRRVDKVWLPEHFDTEQYLRNNFKYAPNDFVTVTAKLHGSSVRISRTIVKRKLTWTDRLAKRFGVHVAETELAVIGGSRRVIKDPGNDNQNHYYGQDIWTEAAIQYGDQIPPHVILYGELIGWLDNTTPLQKGYTYNLPRGDRDLYVYRVAVIAPDGGLYDLSWEGVKTFCKDHGFKHVPELWSGLHKDFDPAQWIDRRFYDEGFTQALPLSDPNTVDEGVCIRRDDVIPFVTKLKGPRFFEYETALLDKGEDVLS